MNTLPAEEKFLEFMKQRELIRLRRELKLPREQWTRDPIFQTYSFTNVHRFYDRTTQILHSEIYTKHRTDPFVEQMFNVAVYRWFGSADFARVLGWQEKFDEPTILRAAKKTQAFGMNVFTGAYIVPACGRSAKKIYVACDVLREVWSKTPELVAVARKTNSWQSVYEILTTLTGYGGSGFMAKEMLQDAMLLPVLEEANDRYSWTPVGPGARRGLNRIYKRGTRDRMRERDAVGECLALHRKLQRPWERWREAQPDSYAELQRPTLKLGAHDVQFQLCEYDKYQRVKHGEGRPRKKFQPRTQS